MPVLVLFRKQEVEEGVVIYRALALKRNYTRILKNGIARQILKIEEQSKLRAGRSCLENIFVLQQLMEKTIANNTTIHYMFRDLKNTCDRMPSKLFRYPMTIFLQRE